MTRLFEKALKGFSSRGKSIYVRLLAWSMKRGVRPFTIKPGKIHWTRISGEAIKDDFIYKDESWNEIKFIHARGILDWWRIGPIPFVDNPCTTRRVAFSGKSLSIDNAEPNTLRWIFLRHIHPLGTTYAIEYDVTVGSEFSELQFAFNYRSIMDRSRFMIADNRTLIFETLTQGSFLPAFASTPLRLEIGRKYHTRIEIIGDSFRYIIDGEPRMSLTIKALAARPGDSFALIFFEKESDKPILAQLDNLRVFRGKYHDPV
jgi:hypothetical protein